MEADDSFADLIRRVRAGDADAATQLVRQYEPEIRRAVRVRLSDSRLHRVLDSVDVCQSVLANFFVRASAGQFDLDQPDQVLRLLVTMARNKLLDKARQQQAARRDQRRVQAVDSAVLGGVVAPGPSPSQIVAGKELLQAMRQQLSEEERYLADQRAQGRDWADIAQELGATTGALQKKMARAMDRVVRRLGLDKVDDA